MNYVPKDVAICHDCSGVLAFYVSTWDEATAIPRSVRIECDEGCDYTQSLSEDSDLWRSVAQSQVEPWAQQHARVYYDTFLERWDVFTTAEYERYCDRVRLARWNAWARAG